MNLILAAIMGKNATENITITSEKRMTTEHQQFLVLHLG